MSVVPPLFSVSVWTCLGYHVSLEIFLSLSLLGGLACVVMWLQNCAFRFHYWEEIVAIQFQSFFKILVEFSSTVKLLGLQLLDGSALFMNLMTLLATGQFRWSFHGGCVCAACLQFKDVWVYALSECPRITLWWQQGQQSDLRFHCELPTTILFYFLSDLWLLDFCRIVFHCFICFSFLKTVSKGLST